MPHVHKDIFSHIKDLIKPGLRGFLLFFLLTFGLLMTLGTWQLQRLEWKNNLIKTINTNLEKPPVSLDDLLMQTLHQKPDYRRVTLTGTLETDQRFKLLMKVHKEKLGYHLIIPLILQNGARVMVDLGWVSNDIDPKDIDLPQKPLTLTGLVKSQTGRSNYTPDNIYEKGELFFLDPVEVATKKSWATLLPFYVIKLPSEENEKLAPNHPLPIKISVTLSNNHLGYAITWYLLALFWGLIFALYARRKMKGA